MQATTNTERGTAGAATGAEPGYFLARPVALLRLEGGMLLAMSVCSTG